MNSPFTVGLAGALVRIESDSPDVEDLVRRELGAFFSIEGPGADDQAQHERLLAVIRSRTDTPRPPQSPGDWTVLHDGSHDYDKRHGIVWTQRFGVRVIHSLDTGSLICADPGGRAIDVVNADARRGAADVRRLVRDLLFIPWLESHGAVVVHGAAVVDRGGRAVLILGDRGAGKTTLFMASPSGDAPFVLSCERIILVPEPGLIRAYACPENVSIFPGMLRQFPTLRSLVGGDVSSDWDRESKIRVPWRTLHDRLGMREANGVPVGGVLYPRWSSDSNGEHAAMHPREAWEAVMRHTITGRDVNRPDWLKWFTPAHTQSTLAAIADLPACRATWATTEDAARLIREGVHA